MSLNSEASMENNQQHVECTLPKQTKTKQNGTMETVLTKLYSKEMVTKNKPNVKNEFFALPSVPFFLRQF